MDGQLYKNTLVNTEKELSDTLRAQQWDTSSGRLIYCDTRFHSGETLEYQQVFMSVLI